MNQSGDSPQIQAWIRFAADKKFFSIRRFERKLFLES